MIKLSQCDPRWQNVTLGKSRYTIGRYGCTTTAISMLSDYFKCFQPPDAIAKGYAQYNLDGMILWPTLKFTHMAFQARLRNRDDKAIQQSLKDPNTAVILNVNNGAHWVTAIGKVPFMNHYYVIDPWDGKKKTTMAFRNVVGSAHFIAK